jgi:type II secretory pathway pseudopilin PulG
MCEHGIVFSMKSKANCTLEFALRQFIVRDMSKLSGSSRQGFTFVALLVVITVVAGLFAIFLMWIRNARNRSIRISCVNNVKQCQLAFIVWSGDHEGQFPMAVSNKLGGTLEWVAGGNAFRHFQVMSNELSATVILRCPADARPCATNWTYLKNQNISFFVGLDAIKTNPKGWLCGDRNITNGLATDQTVMTLEAGQSAGWTEALHNKCGNVALADGSVRQLSNSDLRKILQSASGWTNHLALPE